MYAEQMAMRDVLIDVVNKNATPNEKQELLLAFVKRVEGFQKYIYAKIKSDGMGAIDDIINGIHLE